MATKRASRERCRSVSMNVAPRATAFLNDASVFSGACPDAPRCPITSTQLLPFSQFVSFVSKSFSHQESSILLATFIEDMLTPPSGPEAGIQLPCILNLNSRETKGRRPRGNHEKGTPGPVCNSIARRALYGIAIFRSGSAARKQKTAQRNKVSGTTFERSSAPARDVAVVFRIRQSCI